MLSLINLENYLKDFLKTEDFNNDYAPHGLQVEAKPGAMKRLAFAVSATQESINQAIEFKADALIVHHGVFWKHQGARPITGPWGERIKKLISHNINLLAFHLPLDAHLEVGNAAVLARSLGLEKIESFAKLGVHGEFKDKIKANELQKKIAALLNHPVIHASYDNNSFIKTMGIITGGAAQYWSEALKLGLDSFLTGEISEYHWHDAREAKLHLFAGGHHATERFGVQSLMNHLQEKFPELEVIFFDSLNEV